MKKILSVIAVLSLLAITGCAEINPLSPNQEQEIDNTNGEIEELKNNQNGLMLELGKIRQQVEVNARDIGNFQQGMLNSSNQNSGIQILQGEGSLVFIFALATISMILIYHYYTRYKTSEKISNVLSDQIAIYDDINLDNAVFMAAINQNIEKDVYDKIIESQSKTGTTNGNNLKSLNYKRKISRAEVN